MYSPNPSDELTAGDFWVDHAVAPRHDFTSIINRSP